MKKEYTLIFSGREDGIYKFSSILDNVFMLVAEWDKNSKTGRYEVLPIVKIGKAHYIPHFTKGQPLLRTVSNVSLDEMLDLLNIRLHTAECVIHNANSNDSRSYVLNWNGEDAAIVVEGYSARLTVSICYKTNRLGFEAINQDGLTLEKEPNVSQTICGRLRTTSGKAVRMVRIGR